jgi:NAD(P)-dependent dehydrogenase (short-subunit alcohol dehydrogenase family)
MSSVLITGSNRGIGRAVAAEFARRGHRVVVPFAV